MIDYGEQIGKKFNPDGTPRRYPGNTVISDIRPGHPAYGAFKQVQKDFAEGSSSGLFIFLPEDSFHITVIRGLNDLVRTDGTWPPSLDRSAPMKSVDEHVFRAVLSVPDPGPFNMRFHRVDLSREDLRVLLLPDDENARRQLKTYRDRVADAIGIQLPGHDGYSFHVTLAYTRHLPDLVQRSLLEEIRARCDTFLLLQPSFRAEMPRMAYYEDMLHYSDVRDQTV